MGVDCGFDIYPPLERNPANQALYELFLREVLVAYGLSPGNGANPDGVGDSNDVVRVNAKSDRSYLEFMVGEHPRMPRRCEHFLRFSSKISGSSVAGPHIETVCKIAKQHLGDRVYSWNETNDFGAHIHQYGCYNWNEIRAAERRIDELKPEEQEEERKEVHQGELHQGGDETDTMTHPPVNGEQLYAIKPIPGRGQGVIATSKISKGTRILLEAPIFKMPGSTEGVHSAESAVLREVRSLSRDQQRAFFALQNAQGRRYTPLLGIAQTNLIPLTGNDAGNGGLFLEASRINHSCQPNTQHAWNTSLGCLTVHALHDIEIGCEITISYISGLSLGYAERQRYLRDGFSFSCTCELCLLPLPARLRSDGRLAQIQSTEENCGRVDLDKIYSRHTESFHRARRLFELLEEEGIRDIRLSKACVIAFRIASVVGHKRRARVFAERAYAAHKLLSGDDNPKTIAFKRLAGRPVEDPLYGAMMKCYEESWEPPQDMGAEEFEKWLWNTDGWSIF